MPPSISRPLEGIRVVDLTVALSGPYGTMLLGGLGAEVIQVEAPGGSNLSRANPPFVGPDGLNFGAQRGGEEVSLSILDRARNKRSITLDLKSKQGHAIFLRLLKECDVLIENMSDGVAAKLGVDYDSLKKDHPGLIYASIKAFDEASPYAGVKGMDVIVQAASGMLASTGFSDGPPLRCGLPVADLVAPLYAVNGILSALIYRGRTGEGQLLKVSMLDCIASWVAEEHADVLAQAGVPIRSGNFHDRLVPFGVYATKDGHVAIAALQPEWMKSLLDALGKPELMTDPRFASRGPRMKNAGELNRIIEEWTRANTSEAVIRELVEKRSVPAARVRSPIEVLADESLQKTGAVMALEHPTLGPTNMVGMGLPIQFSKTPSQFDQPAELLGASNDRVYRELLKMSPEELERLRAERVI